LEEEEDEEKKEISGNKEEISAFPSDFLPPSDLRSLIERLKVAENNALFAQLELERFQDQLNKQSQFLRDMVFDESIPAPDISNKEEDEDYFASYDRYTIHEEMLKVLFTSYSS
jgi:hypothetical protein